MPYRSFSCSDWIAPSLNKNSKRARCKYCKQEYAAKLTDLKTHAKTPKHINSVEEAKKTMSSTAVMDSFVRPSMSDEQKRLELKIAAYIADSAIAFRQSDGLVDLIKSLVKKKTDVDKLTVRFFVFIYCDFYLLRFFSAWTNEMHEIGYSCPWTGLPQAAIGRFGHWKIFIID
jgi:hypothetical protein